MLALWKLVAGILDIFGSIASIMSFGGKTPTKAGREGKRIQAYSAGDYKQSLERIKEAALDSCDTLWLLRSYSPSATENQLIEKLLSDIVNSKSPPNQVCRNLYLDLRGTLEEILRSNAFKHAESLIEILGAKDKTEVRYFTAVSFIIDLCIIDNRVIFIAMSEGSEGRSHIRESIAIDDEPIIGFF